MKLNSGASRNEIFDLPSAILQQTPKVIQFLKKKAKFQKSVRYEVFNRYVNCESILLKSFG